MSREMRRHEARRSGRGGIPGGRSPGVALVLALALLLAPGCEERSAPEPSGFSVTDSAGVAVVSNRWGADAVPVWEPHEAPLLRLGTEEADSPELFGRITEARVGPDGSLWIVDGLVSEIRVFAAPGGAFRFAVGGRGEGPGEFRSVRFLGFDAEGAWFWDRTLGRVTAFSLAGELRGVHPLGQDLEILPGLIGRTDRGSFVTTLPGFVAGPVSEGMIIPDTSRLWEVGLEALDPRLIVEQPGQSWYMSERGQVPVPFTDGGRHAARGNRVVVSDPDGSPMLRVFDGGRLVMRVQTDLERARVSPAETQAAWERMAPGGRVPDGLPVPSRVPAWGFLQLGSDGSLLAMRYFRWPTGPGGDSSGDPPAAEWDVFSPDGRHRGVMVLPYGWSLLDFTPEVVLVSVSAEMEGPRVHLHASPEWD